jgi:hypothetical protein
MFDHTLYYPVVSYPIGALFSSSLSGALFGHHWVFSAGSPLHSILVLMGKLRWSIVPWFILFGVILKKKQWDSYLNIIQHIYNRAIHSSIGCSSFDVCHGFHPLEPPEMPLHITLSDSAHHQ